MSIVYILKTFLLKKAANSEVYKYLYYHGKYSFAKFMQILKGEEGYAKWFFHLYMGGNLNLNNPTTLADKLWWLKINNRDPLMTQYSDKNAARKVVEEYGFSDILIPQYDVLDNVSELDLTKYKDEIVVKCTHNSGGHLFYNPEKKMSEKELKNRKKILKYILKKNASILSLEWNYKNIPPKLVVEKVIRDKKGHLPEDYKIWCFDGEPKLVFIYFDRLREDMQLNDERKCNILDMEFNKLDVKENIPNSPVIIEKPENWERMVEIAKTMSQPFPFCRVDLYNVDGKIYFGEFTFYDSGGCVALHPDEWDTKVASWIDINSPKVVRNSETSIGE